MPPHSNAVAMIELYYAISGEQAPWRWPKWVEVTGVRGLFGPEKYEIPPGWTSEDAAAVKTFFEAYRAKSGVDAKLAFASARTNDDYRGRVLWREFISKNWRKWKVQGTILEAFAYKNLTYTQTMIANGMLEVPDSIPYYEALDQIAFALFGESALDGNGKVKYLLRKPISTLAVNASNNLRNATRALVKRFDLRKREIDNLLSVVASSDATMQGVKELTKLVGLWKKDVHLWPSDANLESLSDVEGELAGIMVSLGGQLELGPSGKKPGKKIIRKNAKALAKAETEAAAEALAMLVEHFAADEEIPELFQSINVDFGGLEEGMDPGVSYEATKTFEELCSHLAYESHGRSPMFNTYRHTGTKRATPSSDPSLFESFQKLGSAHPDADSFKEISFHYHQIQGTHSIVRQFFTEQPHPKNPLGVVIADAPGLGKTAMAIASAVFLISVGLRQDKGLAPPPIIGARPFLGESEAIPDHPTLIIAPGTLTAQWIQEFRVFVKPGVVALFNYPTSKPARSKFFNDDSSFATSVVPLRNRVIVATQSTLFTEFRDLYEQPNTQEKRDFPWTLPRKKATYQGKVRSTLFGRDYLCVVLDEAHFCRNPGPTHWGPLAIMEHAKTRLVMTATPVQTRVEDIGAMGRLANISLFSSQPFADEIANDAAELRRAKVDDPSSMRALQVQASRRMQLQFSGALICRSVDSKDYHGKPLLSLPPKTVHYVHLQLQTWELEFVDQSLTQESFEQMAMAKMQGIQTESLFSNERLTVTLPREDRKQPIPKVGSKRVWVDMGQPTKITATKDLIAHLLLGDDAPLPIVDESGITYPSYTPGETSTQTRKILIYQEFPVYMDLLREVLGVYGIFALALNGSMTYPARERVVKEFKASNKYRCLIISKVGAVGLNLTEADTLIFLDQQWSYADENQAIGRIYRQGQTQPVSVYHILAAGTVDYYMSMLARGKALISQAFLTTEKQRKLASILVGDDMAFGGSDEEGEGSEMPVPKVSKGKAKKVKVPPSATSAAGAGPLQAPAIPLSPPPDGEKKKKKKKKTSRRVAPSEIVDDSEPERKRESARAKRASNWEIDLTEDDPPAASIDEQDIHMRTESDASETFASVASLPPPSSRGSSKVRSEHGGTDVSMEIDAFSKKLEAVSGYRSSSSSGEEPVVKPKPKPKMIKRDRSDSAQQVSDEFGATNSKRPKHPQNPPPPFGDEFDSTGDEVESIGGEVEQTESGLAKKTPHPGPTLLSPRFLGPGRQAPPPAEPSSSQQDWEDAPKAPYTQKPSTSYFAQKSASSSQLAAFAEQELMKRRMPGGSDPHIRGRGLLGSSDGGSSGNRKQRSGIGKASSTPQARPIMPKLPAPKFGSAKRNPFASSSSSTQKDAE